MSRLRISASVFACIFVAVMVLCAVAPAFGVTVTGPASFSAYAPADGTSVGVVRPPISVKATDAKGLSGSPYYSLKLDGAAQTATMVRTDANTIMLSLTPRVDLANGNHTVYASVRNASGQYSTTTWTFTVSRAPNPSAPMPVPGSTVTTTSPVISVTVGGSTAGLTSAVLVDGTTVPATFNATTGLLSTPPTKLANDRSHDVTVTVTNSAGVSATMAWSFAIQIYAPMPQPASGCVGCHAGYPDAHPMDNCVACHGPNSPVGEGWNVPDYGPHPASYIAQTADSCVSCHSGGYPSVPALHAMGAVEPYHDSQMSCDPCHVRSLTTEHNRYGYDCLTCHASLDPIVGNAIATGQTSCDACHPNGAAHEGLHKTTLPEGCDVPGCHSGDSLGSIHPPTVTCATCHKSTSPAVVAAIANHDKSCEACHGSDVHAHAHDGTAPQTAFITLFAQGNEHAVRYTNGADVSGCGACHAASLPAAHAGDCSVCHASSRPEVIAGIANGAADCTVCHASVHPRSATHPWDYNYCTGCHDEVSYTLDVTRCSVCHATSATPDTQAPVTSSNALSAYVGPGVVEFAMRDNGGKVGVGVTYSKLDGGSAAPGNSVQVSSPGSHTLEFWSVDQAGNVEATKTASFSVTADTRPPVTTSDLRTVYDSAAKITLSPTDNGTLGVKATYYVLDGGAQQTGTVIVVPAPTSGTASHTLTYWSVDYAGNVESAQTYGFTIAPDHTPPVTNSNLQPYYTTANITITLSASDSGSGVKNTQYKLDGVGPYGYTGPINRTVTEGPHTLEFWSTDNAGNVEAHQLKTFVGDWTIPTVAADVQPSYPSAGANITITGADGPANGAGLQGIAYSVDGAAQQTAPSGTAVHVTGDGQHSIEYWAIDNAGNVSAHAIAFFTIGQNVVPGTATIRLQWGNGTPLYFPSNGDDSTVSWTVRIGGANGAVVSSGSAAASSGWAGTNDIVVNTSSQPYYVYLDWFDASTYGEGPTIFPNVLLNAPSLVTLTYNTP